MNTLSPALRRKLSAGLFALAFLLILIAGPMLYVSTVIEDEDAFVAIADQVVDQPEVRRAIAGEVAELAFQAIEVDETIAAALPAQAQIIAVPAARIASQELTNVAFGVLDTDVAIEARSSALREVHRQVTADQDEVIVDLRAVLVRTTREIGGPTIGAGAAKVASVTNAGRFTLAEAGSPESDLLAAIRGVPGLGWVVGVGALISLAGAVVVANDRRRGLVVGGFVLAGGAIASTLIVSAVLFLVLSALANDSTLGNAVVEVVAADFAQQQRGAVLNGLILVAIGTLLGNRPAAVAFRRLPGDLWYRRPSTLNDLGALVGDNPPLTRAFVWTAGLFTILVWTAPSWRVILTIIALTAIAQVFVWLATGISARAERWRSAANMRRADATADSDSDGSRSTGRLRMNIFAIAVIVLLFWPSWSRSTVAGFFVAIATVLALIDLPKAWRLARADDASDEIVDAKESKRSTAGAPAVATGRPRYLTAGLIAVAAVGVGTIIATTSVESAKASEECNGSIDLCDRRIDEVVFAGAHNAMSSSDLGWDLALQTGDMVAQLDHGIRALLIDALYWDSEGSIDGGDDPAANFLIESALSEDQPRPGTWLCHGFCALGATDLTAGLSQIDLWMQENSREVLLIMVQDEVSVDDLTKAFDDSGLLARTHVHQTGTPFPTLGELIDSGERLLVYTENNGEPDTWLQNGYADTFGETPYTFSLRSQFSCDPNRGGDDNPLLLVNHWLTTGIPIREAAAAVNSRDALLERVRDCEAERGRLPTILATDFVQTGDLVEVVAELNETTG